MPTGKTSTTVCGCSVTSTTRTTCVLFSNLLGMSSILGALSSATSSVVLLSSYIIYYTLLHWSFNSSHGSGCFPMLTLEITFQPQTGDINIKHYCKLLCRH